jgi:two-component system, OmpR family, response regulator MprA
VNADAQRRLLVVETGPESTEALRHALSVEGYYVALAAGESDAIRIFGTGSPDAVIVDLPPCQMTAVAVCQQLREQQRHLPLLALSPDDSVRDSVAGLAAGADDYLVRPFAVNEFLDRVSALLRRSDAEQGVLRFSDLTLDSGTRAVTRGDRRIDLTPIEFSLLELLLRNPGRVIHRTEIFRHVWGFDFGSSSNSLNVYVGYLRRKIEAAGEPRLIHTVRGVGYVLRDR